LWTAQTACDTIYRQTTHSAAHRQQEHQSGEPAARLVQRLFVGRDQRGRIHAQWCLMRKIIYSSAGFVVLAIAAYIAWQHWRSTDEIEAAKELVARNVLVPATARFAPRHEWVAETLPSGAIRLRAWVDSDNGFGLFFRRPFTVDIQRQFDSWKLNYLAFDDAMDAAIGTYEPTANEQI
jgi:hypothetical protein